MQVAPGNILPQEGTDSFGVGESLGVPTGTFCPSYSGGGTNRNESFDSQPIGQSEEEMKASLTSKPKAKMKCEEGKEKKGKDREKRRKEREKKKRSAGTPSDSDSTLTGLSHAESTGSLDRLWQSTSTGKRRRRNLSTSLSLTDDESVDKETMPPPTLIEVVKKNRRSDFLKRSAEKEEQVENLISTVNKRRVALDGSSSLPAAALKQQSEDDISVIVHVATKSRNLNGPWQNALKKAGNSLKNVVDILLTRTSNEEVAILQVETARLKSELNILRSQIEKHDSELTEIRKDPTPSPNQSRRDRAVEHQVSPSEEFMHSIMTQVGNMVNARLEALSDRLLPEKRIRPPLATDNKKETSNSVIVKSAIKQTKETIRRADATPTTVEKKKKGKGKSANPAEVVQPPSEEGATAQNRSKAIAFRPAYESTPGNEWTEVKKKRKKRKDASKASVGTKHITSREVKLHTPKSAAVVITLQPEAIEKGHSYSKILSDARKSIDITDCGITSPLKVKKAVTGAYIFEVSGTDSRVKADTFAIKLREVLNVDQVKVSRPEKTAELRISGLDESVTAEDVAAAVAKRVNCTVDSIRVGQIRRSKWQSLGVVWLRCPVTAAKMLQEDGKLLVGWVAAKVEVLPTRPMRCYRCLEIGHVLAHCTSVDRRSLCYRCGRADHTISVCSNTPQCVLCASANLKADHLLGSKQCSPPRKKKGAEEVLNVAATNPQQRRTQSMDCN